MSLVAYEDSSDDSDHEENDESTKVTIIEGGDTTQSKSKDASTNGQISDDDDDDYLEHSEEEFKGSNFSLSLPKPRKETTIQEIVGNLVRPFAALPMPKVIRNQNNIEEDDEFLHKKDNFVSTETKPTFNVPVTKGPVKISVPSLKEFRDVHMEMMDKAKVNQNLGGNSTAQSSGLLSILPKAKSERSFSKNEVNTGRESKNTMVKKAPSLIPDTVKYRRPAYSTEGVNDDIKIVKKINPQKKKSDQCSRASDDEDNAAKSSGSDFFSLQADDDDSLPEVSANEISMMVAKKAAKMAEATNKYLNVAESKAVEEIASEQRNQQELDKARKRYQDTQLDSEAAQALVGSSAKRRRNQNEQISVVDLNSDQILPNRDEWMRTALASSTTYQPTGVLVDEEPVAGTRRKHQITYLAHKAKANEAELQAIWAANRQTRRATQSKYGF